MGKQHYLPIILCITGMAFSGDIITLNGSRWTGFTWSWQNSAPQRVKNVFGKSDLSNIIKTDLQAYSPYLLSQRYCRNGFILSAAGAAIVIGSLLYSREVDTRFWITCGIAAVPLGFGFVFDVRSSQKLRLSVNIFNANAKSTPIGTP
jgi:hypothetical protein